MNKSTLIVYICFLSACSLFAQEIRKTGLKISDEKLNSMNLIEKPFGFGSNLPKDFSLEKYVKKVGDQGESGTCVAWSTTYYAASIAYNVLAASQNLPSEYFFNYDPLFTYEEIKVDDNECDQGAYIEDALKYLVLSGVKRQEIDSSFCGFFPSWFKEKYSLLDITGAYYLYNFFDDKDTKVEAVCQMLTEHKPVIIGMELPRSFFGIGSDGLFNPADNEPVLEGSAHAMCVVGYDDSKMGGAFRVVNSWGTSWGDNGFFWVKYDDFVEYVFSSYFFEYELKNVSSADNGCIYGDCENGYGVKRINSKKGNIGIYEGLFTENEFSKGIYYNPSKKNGRGGIKWMLRILEKSNKSEEFNFRLFFQKIKLKFNKKKRIRNDFGKSKFIFEEKDSDHPIGFILN
jgi:hypothetical protein